MTFVKHQSFKRTFSRLWGLRIKDKVLLKN